MNGMVDTAVMILLVLLITIGCYAIWDSKQVYEMADAAQYRVYKPTEENGGLSFKELQEINPDVFAWLTIYGTNIDYPVVQGSNNMEYINTNAAGRYSLSGAIFLDYRSSKEFSDFSSILYGHHMEKNTMFGEIECFAGKEYFEARQYGMLYFNGKEHGLEFFAFVRTNAYDETVYRRNITGKKERQNYLERLRSIATHTRDIQVTANDRIVLLSTCSEVSTNGRDILIARITDERYDDLFKMNGTDKNSNTWSVDSLSGLWVQMPLWAQLIIIGLLLILLILLVSLIINNKNHYRNKKRGTQTHRKGDQ